jgi:hypothetical protein
MTKEVCAVDERKDIMIIHLLLHNWWQYFVNIFKRQNMKLQENYPWRK